MEEGLSASGMYASRAWRGGFLRDESGNESRVYRCVHERFGPSCVQANQAAGFVLWIPQVLVQSFITSCFRFRSMGFALSNGWWRTVYGGLVLFVNRVPSLGATKPSPSRYVITVLTLGQRFGLRFLNRFWGGESIIRRPLWRAFFHVWGEILSSSPDVSNQPVDLFFLYILSMALLL